MCRQLLFLGVITAVVAGCGDNLPSPPPSNSFLPPGGLKAFSVNQTTVALQWDPANGASDSTFQGYIVQTGSQRDTLGKDATAFLADSLPPGESAFFVYSLKTNGVRSDAATIHWAPAWRFDSTYRVYESITPVSVRDEGFNVGTSTTNPSTMQINLDDPVVQQTMDLFFNGDSVETHQSLSMWSAHLRLATLNHTLFSTQTDAAPSLDLPLASFPPEYSFTKDSIAVVDNTIYYAKVVGDPFQTNFARLHLHVTGSVGNRIVEVHVSLQRVPGLLYAFAPGDFHPPVISLRGVMMSWMRKGYPFTTSSS